MGATKRVAEQIVQEVAETHRPQLRRGAVRQRARQPRQRGADLPAADPERRAGHGDASRDAPLLHDDSRGGAAGAAGGRDREGRRGVRARHGRAGQDPRSRHRPDPAVRASRWAPTSRSGSPAPGRARSSTRSCSSTRRTRCRPTTRRCSAPRTACCPIGLSTVVDLLVDGARHGWTDEQLRALLVRLVPEFRRQRTSRSRWTWRSPAPSHLVATTMIVVSTPSTCATVASTPGRLLGLLLHRSWPARRPPRPGSGSGHPVGEDRLPLHALPARRSAGSRTRGPCPPVWV